MRNENSKVIELKRVQALVEEVFDSFDLPDSDSARPTKRSATMLKLEWLGERLRRAERIKKQLIAGTYEIDSRAVARKLLNQDS